MVISARYYQSEWIDVDRVVPQEFILDPRIL